jgi:hypothetical protein
MRRSIGTFALRFAATVVLFAPDAFARDANSVSLCPPSLRMTERDGCQPSNGFRFGSLPARVNDDAAEQLWKEILALINNLPSEIQYCVWRGPLRSGWTLEAARAEISKCQQEETLWNEIVTLINRTSSEIQYCVRKGPLRNGWTVDKARAEISRCQREEQLWKEKKQISARNLEISSLALRFAQVIAGLFFILLLALTIRFRAKIAAGLYNLFVGCLALRLRFDRSRKRFLDNAIKEAENRLS